MDVATGCGCKEVYRFPHTTYPYSSCICSFLQQHPYLKKMFFVLYIPAVVFPDDEGEGDPTAVTVGDGVVWDPPHSICLPVINTIPAVETGRRLEGGEGGWREGGRRVEGRVEREGGEGDSVERRVERESRGGEYM